MGTDGTTYCQEHERLEPFVELKELEVPDVAALEYAVAEARQVRVQLGCGGTKNVIRRRTYVPETAYD